MHSFKGLEKLVLFLTLKINSAMYKNFLMLTIYIYLLTAGYTFAQEQSSHDETSLLVHKTPTCGCCINWVQHIKDNGFNAFTQDHDNLNEIKDMHDIRPQYRSCHTAVSPEGYIFEGHVPSQFIAQFLSESHPDALGLSVPGMPIGSPGMEAGDRFMPYEVLILYRDGTSDVYAEVNEN